MRKKYKSSTPNSKPPDIVTFEDEPGDTASSMSRPGVPQHSIPTAVRGDDPAFDFEAKEQAATEPHPPSELKRLESVVAEGEKKHREAIEALRTIREQKLFRHQAADAPDVVDWPENGFDSFDDYMECRWRRTRNWATQEINWLRACECLEANGKGPYQFSKQAIQPAAYLLERDPEGFCEVYLGAAAKTVPVTEEAIRESLKAYQHCCQVRDDWERWQENAKVPEADRKPVTNEEAVLLNMPHERRYYQNDLVEMAKAKAEATGNTWQDELTALCKEHRRVPLNVHLLGAVRGEDLKNLLTPLRELVSKWEDQDRAAHEAAELKKRAKEIEQKYDLAKPKPKTKGKPPEGKQADAKPTLSIVSDSEEDASGESDAGAGDDGEEADDALPEAAEFVTEIEKRWGTELTVAYLLQAGVKCWEVAFQRLDPLEPKHKEAAEYFAKEMAAILEQFNGVEWADLDRHQPKTLEGLDEDN